MSSKSMMSFDRKKHWETIYKTKETKDVSWFQPTPETSLSFIKEFNIPLVQKLSILVVAIACWWTIC